MELRTTSQRAKRQAFDRQNEASKHPQKKKKNEKIKIKIKIWSIFKDYGAESIFNFPLNVRKELAGFLLIASKLVSTSFIEL